MGFINLDIPYPIDSPERTLYHKTIIQNKKFMKELYVEWYLILNKLISSVPEGKIVEIGSGGGFIQEILPQIITSDVINLPTNNMTFSALEMPFQNNELSAIVMIDTFHHLPDCNIFLQEASRVLKPGGKIVMIEPANSIWGRFIYKNFHHEPFNPKGSWTFPESGPLSGANGALPWIVFKRDKIKLSEKFPVFKIKKYRNHTPLRYLISGGLTLKQLLPNFMYKPIKFLERIIEPLQCFSMFTTIEVEKIE